jgi:hypothetical protein
MNLNLGGIMPVKTYHITPLKFDAKLAVEVGQRRAGGASISSISKALKLSAGKVAMAELVATTEVVTITDPALLARAIVKVRKAGASWGLLAARYLVTEGTARAAYEAATGQPFTTLDYRKAAKPASTQAKPKKAAAPKKPAASPIKRGGVKAARRIQEALDTQGVVIA